MSFSSTKRRLISAVIACLLVITVSTMSVCAYNVSSGFASSSYGQRLAAVQLTGNYRTDLCAVALSQTGYHESGDNYTEYGAYFGINGSAWCGAFVSWCARQAGIPTSTINTCFGTTAGGFGVSARDTSYTPVAGDLAFFAHGHVAIVTGVDASYIYIVHGNWSDSVVTSSVPRSSLSLSGYAISGFGTYYSPSANKLTISYNAGRGTIEGSDQTTTKYTVKAGTGGLNLRSTAEVKTDNQVILLPEGTSFTVSATKKSGDYTWGLTTYSGKSGWVVINNSNWVSTSQTRATTYYVTNDGMIHLSSTGAVHTQVLNQGVINTDGLYDDTTFHITRDGYTFLGWAPEDGLTVFDKTTPRKAEDILPDVVNGSRSLTLYAVWDKGTYTLAYHANGGTGAPMSEELTTAKALSATIPSRDGYSFLGWSTDPKATTATYQPGDRFEPHADTTLYAVWGAATLKIYYNTNGGVVSDARFAADKNGNVLFSADSTKVSESWRYNSNVPYGLYNASTFGMSKSGYTFLGWSTNPSCTNLFEEDDESFMAQDLCADLAKGDASVTLYAVWKRLSSKNSWVMIGDVNHDRTISVYDRVFLTRYLAGETSLLDSYGIAAADINKDGEISAADRVYLTRYLAGWGYTYDVYFE